jgi:hypothetical protein
MAIIKKFFELPLGTKFKYLGGKDVWVILERHGTGKVCKAEPHDGWVAGQQILSFADSEEECRQMEVEVVIPPAIPPNLIADFQEFLYRAASQVPFEHANWANERGTALMAQLKQFTNIKE